MGGGSLFSPDGMASSRIVGVSASVIFTCTIKSRRRFLLALADPGSPGKRAVKWLCMCVLCLIGPGMACDNPHRAMWVVHD